MYANEEEEEGSHFPSSAIPGDAARLPLSCPLCGGGVISDADFEGACRTHGTLDGGMSDLVPLGCYGCTTRAHLRCVGDPLKSAGSEDYTWFSSGWFVDPEGWLCPVCAPRPTKSGRSKPGEKRKRAGKARRGRL